jgi:hypothetical protein
VLHCLFCSLQMFCFSCNWVALGQVQACKLTSISFSLFFCLVQSRWWEHVKCSFLLVTQLPSGILSNLIIARICELLNVNLPVLLFRTPLVFEKFTLKAVYADSSSQHPEILLLYYPTCGHSSLVTNSWRVYSFNNSITTCSSQIMDTALLCKNSLS